MRLYTIPSLLLLAGLAACSSPRLVPTSNVTDGTPAVTTHNYNGTASVGDFLTITVDSVTATLNYTNLSNGQSATVPYTINADGSYKLNDPTGNLLAAYEVPGYAMVIESAKSGPSQNTPALITAVESGPITISTFENNNYNYMQMRTAFGGLDVGTANIGNSAVQTSSYWPFGAISGGGNTPFNSSTMPLSLFTENASGTSLTGTVPDGGGSVTLFGTANGFFVVDTANGSILGLPKATSAAFNPANAGTYSAIYYQKLNVTGGSDGVETGAQSFAKATISVSSAGAMIITNPSGTVISQGTLLPVSSVPYLYGTGELTDPCYGLFTYRITTSTTQQDIFVSFVSGAMLFSSFEAPLPWNNSNSVYNYYYGVGLN